MLDQWKWEPLSVPEAGRLAVRIFGDERAGVPGLAGVEGRVADLACYAGVDLYHLTLRADGGEPLDVFALAGDERVVVLDGTSEPFQPLNATEGALTAENVADYLRLFCFAVRGEAGPFVLLEALASEPPEGDGQAAAVAGMVAPLKHEGRDGRGRFLLRVPVHYGGDLFACLFAVGADRRVEMVDDLLLVRNVPGALVPVLPELYAPGVLLARLQGVAYTGLTGAAILRAFVELLLEQALHRQEASQLLTHFNARLRGRTALDRFAQLVAVAAPVVAIESTLPFVEETVAHIVQERLASGQQLAWVRPEVDTGDDTRLHVRVPESGKGVLLLPFHSYRSLIDVERVAHEIAARDVACLIGCERAGDLPESLRRVVDLTLRLPRLDPDLFRHLFLRIMRTALPEDWQDEDTHWVTHVHHADFQHPQGLGLPPGEALAYIRDRARERLRDVEPVDGLGLKDLHGLGEARIFAEDLIADIHDAIAGRLAWQHVDRGVLLVGAPGTGKTTLARAIARDCGIRFVSASASSWQAAGYLNDHIRALRADFALARRFAPAILFIDEIDSIGNREAFAGHNAQYGTQVVNALLEQLQGMDPEAPVVVIAATNHLDRIDPALKRAGRLDRVIEIPHPNVEALARIFRHYLDEYAAEVAPDVDVRALGALAFGKTGADVELFVRGAVRRARKQRRALCQADLIDEITSKPRDPGTSPRLTPTELRRVAVHEAGHAVASFLSQTRAADLTFVSVVPRADGRLGFVASMPSERALLTRKEYLEEIEVLLAGRAAEEIVFGPEGVTGGAQHDLKVASHFALLLTTRYGLGPERRLIWSETPGRAEREEAGRILNEAYATVLGKLRARAGALEALADALVQRQEIPGEEVRTLLAAA
ncbi:AAA family ATPase [Rhodocaloribacter litoris]|uniref:AAA family ATPase n=1 Tax=Rhodocaloribacter litoris TaxID=2558931 RepID=UPI0014229C0A|nr:AAA family ATPase [Rhodocaloribacter litoris]QXD17042.1 AAA family ATPase [Rhodocaloribacter litoris]